MRKFFVVALPIFSLVVFILVMQSGAYFKYSIGKDDNVVALVQLLINNVNDENWKDASVNIDKLSKAWDKVVGRVQYSAERDEINAFSMNVARLRGAIIAKNKANALSELYEAYEHWRELGN